MDSKNTFDFMDKKLLDAIREENNDFLLRITDSDQEYVDYLKESSIRIWLNKETTSFTRHWHYSVEIIVAIENTYTVHVKDTEYVLNPGDIMIIPAGELHELVAPESGSRLVCLFDYEVISQLSGFAKLSPFISQPMCIRRNDTSPLYNRSISLIKQIAREYAEQNPFFELVIYTRLISLFVIIGRSDSEDESLIDSKQSKLNKRLSIAFEYIDSHYTEDLSLDKVASIAGFSKFHFTRMFKECSGQNFHEYLSFKRVQASETLLLKPNYSITEVAFGAGFSSLSTFNRAFKAVNKCSPTEYRMLYARPSTTME